MQDKTESNSTSSNQFRLLDLSLRFLVMPMSAATVWITASNKQSTDSYGKVEFSNLSGLQYLVCVSGISLVYSMISALLSSIKLWSNGGLLFCLDQVMAYLMVTSGSAVAELLYLAHEGDKEVAWGEVCSYFGKFCSKIKLSLGSHCVASMCFVVLSLVSAYRVFSRFEAPALPSKQMAEQDRRIDL